MVLGKILQVGLVAAILLNGVGTGTVSSAGATTATMPAEGRSARAS